MRLSVFDSFAQFIKLILSLLVKSFNFIQTRISVFDDNQAVRRQQIKKRNFLALCGKIDIRNQLKLIYFLHRKLGFYVKSFDAFYFIPEKCDSERFFI